MYNINFEDSAKEYLAKHKINEIYIKPIERKVCCSTYGDFIVALKNRDNSIVFEDVEKDGITVHICDSLSVKDNKIVIAADKFLGFERLFLKGIVYDFDRGRGCPALDKAKAKAKERAGIESSESNL